MTSSRLISTPPAFPSGPITGEQLALKVRSFPAWSVKWSMLFRCSAPSRSAAAQGDFSFGSGAPSGPSQPSSDTWRAASVSGVAPVSVANAWFASTMFCFLSITSRPSASVSSAERTRAGTACDTSRWRSMRPR